jgi:hypothetical protein
MTDHEISNRLDQLGKDLDELAVDIRVLSKDVAAAQKRRYEHITECLDRTIERAVRHNWTQIAQTTRGHPVKGFIERVDFFNAVSVHEDDAVKLREKFDVTGRILVDKGLLSEADLSVLLDKVNLGRD